MTSNLGRMTYILGALFLMFNLGCAGSFVHYKTQDVEFTAGHLSGLRKGPYKAAVDPATGTIVLVGQDEAISSNLTLLATGIGAIAGGPTGAGIGLGAGLLGDLAEKLDTEQPDGSEPVE